MPLKPETLDSEASSMSDTVWNLLIWRYGHLRRVKAPFRMSTVARRITRQSLHAGVIIFIPLSTAEYKPQSGADWAADAAESFLRKCPKCLVDSIIGHGRRRKQAHDESHDWIGIRRGICKLCGMTFTFLPLFSPPYGHYSWITRGHALRDYFLEGKSLESAVPMVKNPDRLPAPSTLRRWFRELDSQTLCRSFEELSPAGNTQSPTREPIMLRKSSSFPFVEKAIQAAGQQPIAGAFFRKRPLTCSWQSLAPFLHILLPLRC